MKEETHQTENTMRYHIDRTFFAPGLGCDGTSVFDPRVT